MMDLRDKIQTLGGSHSSKALDKLTAKMSEKEASQANIPALGAEVRYYIYICLFN